MVGIRMTLENEDIRTFFTFSESWGLAWQSRLETQGCVSTSVYPVKEAKETY